MARVKDSKVRARIVKLQKGDPLAVIGNLKPIEWTDNLQQQHSVPSRTDLSHNQWLKT